MTIIVYVEGTIASDSRITEVPLNYAHQATMKKITKSPKGALAGATGGIYQVQEFLKWIESDKHINPPSIIFEDEGFEGILIYPDRQKYLYTNAIKCRIEAPYIAIGNGFEIALGALYMKADASTAVKAVIAHNIACGGDIQIETI